MKRRKPTKRPVSTYTPFLGLRSLLDPVALGVLTEGPSRQGQDRVCFSSAEATTGTWDKTINVSGTRVGNNGVHREEARCAKSRLGAVSVVSGRVKDVPGELDGQEQSKGSAVVSEDASSLEVCAATTAETSREELVRALLSGRLLLFRSSPALGGRDFYLALGRRAAARAPRDEVPVLTVEDALAIMRWRDLVDRSREPATEADYARARQITDELLCRHGIWIYRDPGSEFGFEGEDWYSFAREDLPTAAAVLLKELAFLPREAAVAAAMVPPAVGDTVESPRWVGEIVEVKLPIQVAIRLPDNSIVYYDPHPWVLQPAGPGRWRVGF